MAPPSRLVATLAPSIGRKGHAMTAMYATSFVLGATAGSAVVHVLWTRWAEQHHYRRVRLEAARVDRIWHDCDHLARHNRRLTDEHAELREGVGELLDTVAHQREVIDQLTEPAPTYADFAYGANQ